MKRPRRQYPVPMFGYLPPPSPQSTPERVQVIDFLDADEAFCARQRAKGVRGDCNGLPMLSYMVGQCVILIDLR